MCGFTGYLSSENTLMVKEVLDAQKLSAYRGKDSFGFLSIKDNEYPRGKYSNEFNYINTEYNEKGNYIIAHDRLSIVDPSSKVVQPLMMEDHIIAFNGTIYNYKDLREKLKNIGIKFISNSDTEVFLKSYLAWGKSSFKFLKGTWAIAIYDIKEKSILLARDRFGEKPLYYHASESAIFFSSSLTSLSKLCKKNILDINSAKFFVENGSPEYKKSTLIKEIKNVLPGSYIYFKNKKTRNIRYWSLLSKSVSNLKNDCDIEENLNRSIEECLTADVGLSCTLSGGLDSGNIYSRAIRLQKIPAYTAITSSHDPQEIILSRQVALKNKHKEINIDENSLITAFKTLSKNIDIPLSLDSNIVDYIVNKKIRNDKNRVVLTGHGGDEVFLGYSSHIYSSYLTLLTKFNFLKAIKYFNKLPSSKFNSIKALISIIYKLSKYYKLDLLKYILKGNSILDLTRQYEMQTFPLYSWLQMSDRTSMVNNIETRSPFLNPDLVNSSLKRDVKFEELILNSKPLLRKISVNVLPKEIYERKEKYGYVNTPSKDSSLTEKLILTTFDNCDQKLLYSLIGLSKTRIYKLWRKTKSQKIWRTFSLIYWMQINHIKR